MSGTRIFFDGGLRPMPRGMEIAVVVRGVAHVRQDLGAGTSVDAEWLALIAAIRLAQAAGVTDPVFTGDSAIVIGQLAGRTRARGGAADHLATALALIGTGRVPRVRHVGRSQNLAGIALARRHDARQD